MQMFSHIKPKLFDTFKGYNAKQLSGDIVSGIIVAIIALPLSIALAIASGVGPEAGLYTAIIAGFFISLLGGSRVQIGGPTAAFVVIIYGVIEQYDISGLIVATLLAGIILILMGLLKLGSIIKFIPKTITIGFTLGIAVSIFAGQLKDFFGLQMGAVPSEFVEKITSYAENFNTVHFVTLGIGALALLIQIFWGKVTKKIPGSLIAIIVTTLIVKFCNLDVTTIEDLYEIKAGFPTFQAPNLSLEMVKDLISPAFTIAILAAIESLLSCVVADDMINDKHSSNAELVGQGVGNIMSALFGGIPATGAIARTAANVKNGGRTPIAGIVHAVTLLVVMLFLMPYASLIPMTTLASVLIMVAYNMSGWRVFIRMIKTSPLTDIIILVLTFLLTVFFDLVVAIEIGMILAVVFFMKSMADTTKVRKWEKKNDDSKTASRNIPENTVVYDMTGPMFFGNTNEYIDIARNCDKKALVLRMSKVPSMDATGLDALSEVLTSCKNNGVTLILSHVNAQPMKVMKKAGFLTEIGEENICANIDKALERACAL